MKTFALGFIGLAGLAVAGIMGTSAAEAASCTKHHPCKAHHHQAHRPIHPHVYAAEPYYDGYGYAYRPLPVYVYGRGPAGIFDFPPDAPGGLLNPEPRPVNENPQQWIMNQQHNRPFSDNEPY